MGRKLLRKSQPIRQRKPLEPGKVYRNLMGQKRTVVAVYRGGDGKIRVCYQMENGLRFDTSKDGFTNWRNRLTTSNRQRRGYIAAPDRYRAVAIPKRRGCVPPRKTIPKPSQDKRLLELDKLRYQLPRVSPQEARLIRRRCLELSLEIGEDC